MSDTAKARELKDEGNAALNAGKFDIAIKCYSNAIRYDSGNHVLYSNRSAAYCKAAQYSDALNDANATIKLKNDWGKGYSRKGAALLYLKRYSEAVEAYKEGLKHDPNNQQLKDALKDTEEQMSRSNQRGFSNPFSGPDVMLKLQTDPRTRDFFNDPEYVKMVMDLQKNPDTLMLKLKDPKMMTTLSVLLGFDLSGASAADDDEEMETPTRSQPPPSPKEEPMEVELSVEKKQAIAEKDKGNEEYKKKNFEAAIAHYDKAIELDPTEITFLTNKAAVYFEKKDYEECVKTCEKAVEIGKENRADFKKIAKAYARMAGAYHKMEDYHKAKNFYEKSLTEHRTQDIVKKVQEIEKFIKDRDRMAYIDPEKALEEKNKGKEFFQKGDYPAAMKHYSEAIRRNPDDAVLYSNRAACYQKLAEFQLALKDCEISIKLDPAFVRAHIRKGMALTALKEHAKAALAFQKAMELDSSNQEAIDGYRKCLLAGNSNPEEIRKQAMSDPEVQRILADPAMRLILEQMQNDPKALQEHLKNPDIAAKIQKLLECGLIAIR